MLLLSALFGFCRPAVKPTRALRLLASAVEGLTGAGQQIERRVKDDRHLLGPTPAYPDIGDQLDAPIGVIFPSVLMLLCIELLLFLKPMR